MLRRIFLGLEQAPLTILSAFTAFLGVVIIRTFLEDITYRSSETFFSTEISTVIHYALFYFVALLGLILILHFATGRTLTKVSAVGIGFFPIILTPPIIDFILFGGAAGNQITYILKDTGGLILNFFTFYHFQELPGMSTGIRIEFALIFIGVFLYIYTFTSSIIKSLIGTTAAYILLFVLFSLPSFLALGSTSPAKYLLMVQSYSLLPQNFIHPQTRFSDVQWFGEMLFNRSMSATLFLCALPLMFLFAWRVAKEKVIAIFKNMRPERVTHYFGLIGIGLWLGSYTSVVSYLNWMSVASIVCLFVAFLAAWLYAVGYNDCVDVVCDELSNQDRPLVTGALSVADIKVSNGIFLSLALLGGYLAGVVALYMVLLFTALYHVYSAPPLKLKRFLGINATIIGLCALSAFLAGYYTMSSYKTIDSFPMSWLLLILFSYTLVANIKDIKDIAGDTVSKVYTIPVVFGDKKGKWIISGLVTIALLLPPLVLQLERLWWPVPLFALGAVFLIHKKPFVERHVFFLYYLYIITAALLLIYG